MTALTLRAPAPPLARVARDAPLLAWTGAALVAAALPLTLAAGLDPRAIDGEGPWLKPLKFALSLGLYAWTLALAAPLLPPALRASRRFRVYVGAVVAAIAAEMAWIGGAAALGLRSHYNEAQPLLAAIYPVMGLVAAFLTSAAAVWGVAILRTTASELGRAVGWSFLATFALTVPLGFALSLFPGGLTAPAAAGPVLPVLGWSLSGADLRPVHFLATHAMQAVPLAALALAATVGLRRGAGAALAAGWAALTLGLAALAFAA